MKFRFLRSRKLISETGHETTRTLVQGIVLCALGLILVASCDTQSKSTPVQIPSAVLTQNGMISFPSPTAATKTSTAVPLPVSPSSTAFVCKGDWQSLPIIPAVTDAAKALYQHGIADGHDPRAFSKIGDGEISAEWFLMDFDLGAGHYNLGNYQNLHAVIENFQGSFARVGIAAKRGFNTNLILDPTAGDPALCATSESPLECELGIHNPSIVILSLGANQVHRPKEFESGMRQILLSLLVKNILPILSTKGDNLEGDGHINQTIACLAQEYQLPLWNFWAAIQPLPHRGLQPDLEHLTYYGINDFSNPFAMQSAWTIRNLTALQALDAVWQTVK